LSLWLTWQVPSIKHFYLYKTFYTWQYVTSTGIMSEPHDQEVFGHFSLHVKCVAIFTYYLPVKKKKTALTT
jgi:hypothetical protein